MSRPHWGTLLTFSPGWTITDEFEGYLQVSKSSLYKLSQEGRAPGQKVGRHWRFHKTAIDAWLNAGGKAATEDGGGQSGER